MQYHHVLRHSLCLIEIVGGKHDTTTSCGQSGNDLSNHFAAVEVDTSGGLIQKCNIRVGGKRQGKGESLTLATRESSPCG